MKNEKTVSVSVSEIERSARQLTFDERLWLLERLVQGLRYGSKGSMPSAQVALAEMAKDPQIRSELAQIEREFASSELDGLE